MRNRYNIYEQMLRAAAGEGSGGAQGSDTMPAGQGNDQGGDDQDDEGNDTMAGGEGADTVAAGSGADTVAAGAGDDQQRSRAGLVSRDVMLRRVGELTRKQTDLSTRNAALEAELAALRAKAGPQGADTLAGSAADQGTAPQRSDYGTKSEFDAAVKAEAARQREVDDFNAQCDAVAGTGEKEYKDWNDSVANLRMLGDDGNIPLPLLNAALAADDPAKALHVLGQNPEEAQRILTLPPYRRVAEVVKHGLKPKAPVQRSRSNAPAPIDPVNGAGGQSGNDGLGDNVDSATWMKNRSEQVRRKALADAGRGGQ